MTSYVQLQVRIVRLAFVGHSLVRSSLPYISVVSFGPDVA